MSFASNIGGLFGGLFGDTDKPYDAAMKEYEEWAKKAAATQNPYLEAGNRGLGNYEDWLQSQKDPTAFINNIMNDYNESPYANYLQQQSLRAGQNAASAAGLMGSTPLFQQLQQNSNQIASGDMNQWLQNVLGINTQYGQGQHNLVQGGQQAANALTNLYQNTGNNMAEQQYNKNAAKQNNFWNTLGSGIGLGANLFGIPA